MTAATKVKYLKFEILKVSNSKRNFIKHQDFKISCSLTSHHAFSLPIGLLPTKHQVLRAASHRV